MAYFERAEHSQRIENAVKILKEKDLDFALVYYDETNVANGWYLTGWCPQFESGCVLIAKNGSAMILGGPESEPFAKQDSAITDTRNLPVFMVPDEEYPNATIIDFGILFTELSQGTGSIHRVGIAGMNQIPYGIYSSLCESFSNVELVDITDEFVKLRYIKSQWEIEQMKKAFELSDLCYEAMAKAVQPGAREYEVAAAGEAIARRNGASGFAFKTIVGSGARSNAVVPTAMDKLMLAGETVMIGASPRYKGYSGCIGHTLPVSGEYTPEQKECIKHMQEVFLLTRDALKLGSSGKEIDSLGRGYYEKHGLMKYLVCPFAHTVGIMEAEAPFFGPNSNDIIVPGMTICVDVSFFGHPVCNGMRIETAYYITEKGAVAFSPKMENILLAQI